MSEQLRFRLPVRTALGREDFYVAPSNAVALALLDAWSDWPQGKMVLSGPTGAGKTHLAHVWAKDSGAQIILATDLAEHKPDDLATAPLVIEDVPDIAQNTEAQTHLFHIHNLMRDARIPLLLTGTQVPNLWAMSLPDLQSRVDAAGHAAIAPPDDELLSVILWKLFSDRQLRPRDDVIPYLVSHMDRSFAAAGRIVSALDDQSLAERREITRAFARQVLEYLAETE